MEVAYRHALQELLNVKGFSKDLPTPRSAINIFDTWTSILPISEVSVGNVPLFSDELDPRPRYCAEIFGPLCQFKILELGSFEGGHAYQFNRLGACSLTCIEANAQSFLKSLVIKETFSLKGSFLYGDFMKYLESNIERFD